MGQELGRALVNLGKPAEVTANEDVEPCSSSAVGWAEEVNVPTQYCETQRYLDQDQRTTGGSEAGKEKTGACSEFVVLQTDDSKIAQILKWKENGKQNRPTTPEVNSDIIRYCKPESSSQKGVCVTTDLLGLKGTTSDSKTAQSDFGGESIQTNGAKQQLTENRKSDRGTKNEAKRRRKLRSIVILKNDQIRKHRKEHDWNSWHGGRRIHKKGKSRSNSSSKPPDGRDNRPSRRRHSSERSIDYQTHTTKYKENIHLRTPSSCRQVQNHSNNVTRRVKSQDDLLCSSWSRLRSPVLKTLDARSRFCIKDIKRERKGGDRDKEQGARKEFGRYRSHNRIKNDYRKHVPEYCYQIHSDEVHRRQSLHERSLCSSDKESGKNGSSLSHHRKQYRKTGVRSISTEHDFYAYENRDHYRCVRRKSTPESSCFTAESGESYELEHESDDKQRIIHLGVESKRQRSLKVEGMSLGRTKADQVRYGIDTTFLKNRRKRKEHRFGSTSQSKSFGIEDATGVKCNPQTIGKNKEKGQNKFKKHQTDVCLERDKLDQAKKASLVGNDNTNSKTACARPNNVLRDLHGKLEDAGKTKGTSDIDGLIVLSKQNKTWLPEQNKSTDQSVAADTRKTGLSGCPQVSSSVQNPCETLDHSNIYCFSDKVTTCSNFKTGNVKTNHNLNTMKSKPASLNASVANNTVLGANAQGSSVPPPVLPRCPSSALSSEHVVRKLGSQLRSGGFGMERRDPILVDFPDNRKLYEVAHQRIPTLSTSFEDTKVTKVTNGALNQLPSVLDLQMQLLNLTQAMSLALTPVAPFANKDTRNLQQDILHQMLCATTLNSPQGPRNQGISTWYKPPPDWDAPSPNSDDLVSFSPPLPKDVDSEKEVNEVHDKHKKSTKEFGQHTSNEKSFMSRKWVSAIHIDFRIGLSLSNTPYCRAL